MLPRILCVRKEAGGLDHNLGTQGRPVDFSRVFHLEHADWTVVHLNAVLAVSHFRVQNAQNRIVFQQVRQGLRVGDVINGDELYPRVVQRGAEDVAPNTPKPVDPYLNRHTPSLKSVAMGHAEKMNVTHDPWRLILGREYGRSEEHTSELQSRPHLVCRL